MHNHRRSRSSRRVYRKMLRSRRKALDSKGLFDQDLVENIKVLEKHWEEEHDI